MHIFFRLRRDSIQSVTGNYIIIKYDDHIYAAFAHLKYGSVKVRIGQKVKKGDLLGCIGHSGNSFFPHLHFQLMDSDDMCSAKGIPCAFANYEVFEKRRIGENNNQRYSNRQGQNSILSICAFSASEETYLHSGPSCLFYQTFSHLSHTFSAKSFK